MSDLPAGAPLDADPPMDVGMSPGGFRLDASMRLGYITLAIAELARSVAYYGSVLGLRVLDRRDDRALLGTFEDETPLVELREYPGATRSPQHGRLGLYHFAILLPDRASLGRFTAHLRDLGVRAGAADHLVSEALYLTDPDGLGIEIYADRPRASWRSANRELAMASDPFDFPAVLDAAHGQPWTGMPAGTRMGHVHFHVAGLDEAAAFYHHALGFDKMVWTFPGALFLATGGYHHHVGLNTWAGRNAPQATTDDARLIAWRMHLSTGAALDDLEKSVRASGFSVERSGADLVATDQWGTTVNIDLYD